MNGETIVTLAFLALVLVLPLLALRGRELDWSKGWKMAVIWVGLFVLAAILFKGIGM